MVQENLREKRLSKDEKFVNSVLEGVPRVSYERPDGGWEFTPFASCLRSCMEFLGEDYTYEYIVATSGAAFRLMWAPHVWDFGNVDILWMAEDTLEPFRRAFEAVGYGYEVIAKSQADSDEKSSCVGAAGIIRSSAIGVDGRTADKAGFKRCIIESIQNKGKPVLAFGVVGPPECCIITGYDEDGDTLIGWSFFQDGSEAYFRKNDWYADTCGLILIGEKQQVPSLSELHQNSLEWALKVLGAYRVEDHNGGPDAYTAWAQDMMRDEDFPSDGLETLRNRLTCHYDAMSMLAERNYAAKFLRQIANHEPNMAQDLEKAAECLEESGLLISKMHEATGGYIPPDDDEKLKKLAGPVVRRQIADAILEARDKHTEAAHHIEQALAKQ